MVYDLFSDFFGDDFFTLKPVYSSHTTKDIECPLCKTRLSKVLKTGKFGCSECYDAFGGYTKQILSNIHSTAVHKGKISDAASEQLKAKKEIEKLNIELKDAIEKQEFEKAATLRDKIKELTEEAK